MSGIVDPVNLLIVSFISVVPAFGWIVAGLVVRRLLPQSAMIFRRGEKFVFYIGMPVVLCLSASQLDFTHLQASKYLLVGTLSFSLIVVAAYLHAGWRGYSLGHRGVVSQSAFRSNLAIIGLALCASTCGPEGLVRAAMPIAVWTLLFNVIAVALLGYTHGGTSSPRAVLGGVLRNPLILGIAVGVLISVAGIPLTSGVYDAGNTFSGLVIPFALVCLGGAINLRSARESRRELVDATVWRLVISPVVAVGLCLVFGLRGIELGVIFLLLGGPAAVACHVMVAAAGGNQRLAANIVMVTTFLAPISLTVGLFALNYFALM